MSMGPLTRIHQILEPHVAERADSIAIVDADGSAYDWRAYARLIDAAAAMLSEQGVRPGDRIAIVAENCAAIPVLLFAASRLDAWAMPINARMAAAEIDRVLAHAEPRLVFYTCHVSPEAAAHAARAEARAISTGFGELALAALQPGAAEAIGAGDGQVAMVLYTTGTTGAPKGVMLTHRNLIRAAQLSSERRGLLAEDHVYGVLPLTHVFGVASLLMASTFAGCRIDLVPRFAPIAMLTALRSGVTVLSAVPQMHALLMACAAEQGLNRLEGTALRYVSSGAAPLDPTWKRKAEAFYGVALQNGYGLTESTAGVCVTTNPMGSPDISVGAPFPGVEVRIDDSVGAEAGVGEVLVRGDPVMKGYFRNPEATAGAIDAEGFLRTGDLGRLDERGMLHLVGRRKELIIRSGFNVYPPEVEAALNDHPEVVQAAVVGRKTADGNEEVVAFVQLAAGAAVNEAALIGFAARSLSPYKRPSRIVIADALPAAPSGKILKYKLIDHFADELDGSPM